MQIGQRVTIKSNSRPDLKRDMGLDFTGQKGTVQSLQPFSVPHALVKIDGRKGSTISYRYDELKGE